MAVVYIIGYALALFFHSQRKVKMKVYEYKENHCGKYQFDELVKRPDLVKGSMIS